VNTRTYALRERRANRVAITIAALVALSLSLMYLARPVAVHAGSTTIVELKQSQQGTASTDATQGTDCGDFTSGIVWHFILNNLADGTPAADLKATFADAGDLFTSAFKVEAGGKTQHFYVNTPDADTLVDAWATVQDPGVTDKTQLVLSHVCVAGPPAESQPEESQPQESQGNTAALYISKEDEQGNRLQGAVFTVEGQSGTFTTNDHGVFCVTGLPFNAKLWVTEIQAPPGYDLPDPAAQLVRVDNDGLCHSPEAVFVDKPKAGESQPEESQPQESQPQESQPQESQPQESQPQESQPQESQPAESQPAQSESPEGSVEAATGTPEASTPNTAFGGDSGNPMGTLLFTLILVGSLGALAYANVRTVRKQL